MPIRAPRICSPCGHRVASGEQCLCERQRAADGRARVDASRPSARVRGYDSKWERESKAYLAQPENRLCACGCGEPANMVDHIVAPKGDQKLFWDRRNWQPMRRACNTRKAIRNEGGFGKLPRRAAI